MFYFGSFAAGVAGSYFLLNTPNSASYLHTAENLDPLGHSHTPPGSTKGATQHMLDSSSAMLQHFGPIKSIHAYVCGFHNYSGELGRPIVAHHYCNHYNKDIHQCVIYDGNESNSRLIGIEYIISEDLFKTLPEEEKKYWHSHAYEVMSGQLVAPRVPEAAEDMFMMDLKTTYGKTIHTWQVDKYALPIGPPQLMMSYTGPGQLDTKLIVERDRQLGIDSVQLESHRREKFGESYVEANARRIPGADGWEQGIKVQFKTEVTKID